MRKFVAGVCLVAGLFAGAGAAGANSFGEGGVVTDNSDNWGVRDYDPSENDYTFPGVENCPGDAVWVHWDVIGYTEDGDKIWGNVCMYD